MSYIKKQKRDASRNLLLEIHKAGGGMTLIFSAPGDVPYFMKPFMLSEHEVDEVRFWRTLNRLQKQEFIKVDEVRGGVELHLLEAGEKKARRYALDELILEKPEKWDGKWRIVTFDIPDEKKVARNYFTQRLEQLGFILIQKSLYAHPFHCEEAIETLRSVYEIKPYVKLITAEHFEGEDRHLSRFGLGRYSERQIA